MLCGPVPGRSEQLEGKVGVSQAKRKEGVFQAEGMVSSKALLQEGADQNGVWGRPCSLILLFTVRFLS